MPKALCLTSLAVAAVVILLFLSDLVLALAGMADASLLRGASLLMDIAFVIVGGIVAAMSWLTFREQR